MPVKKNSAETLQGMVDKVLAENHVQKEIKADTAELTAIREELKYVKEDYGNFKDLVVTNTKSLERIVDTLNESIAKGKVIVLDIKQAAFDAKHTKIKVELTAEYEQKIKKINDNMVEHLRDMYNDLYRRIIKDFEGNIIRVPNIMIYLFSNFMVWAVLLVFLGFLSGCGIIDNEKYMDFFLRFVIAAVFLTVVILYVHTREQK